MQREPGLNAEADAELPAELVARDHDAAFDQDLPDRDIDLADHAPHFLQARRGVLHEQDVGARIDDSASALGQELLLLVGDELLDGFGFLIIKLEHLGLQRLQVADLLPGFELLSFLDRQLLAWRDQNDVAVLAHVQALGLHDDIERLVPGDILEPQRQTAGNRVAGDDVESREIGDDLQHRPDFDVLEIERQLLALVALSRALRQPVRVLLDRLDLEDEAILGLIRRVFPQSAWLDHHPCVRSLRKGVDGRHRRREIGDVEPPLEVPRQRRPQKIDDERAALLADVDARRAVRQVDDDAAFAVASAPEIDVAQSVSDFSRPRFGESRYDLRFGSRRTGCLIGQRHENGVALHQRSERLRLVQIEYDARPAASLDDIKAPERRIADLLRGAGRIRDREASRRVGQRGLQRELDHGPARARLGDAH